MRSERSGAALARLFGVKERNSLAGERHAGMAHRFRGEEPAQTIAVADGLFLTAEAIAAQMVALLDPKQGATVLEPSAGTGRLIDAIQALDRGCRITAVENCKELVKVLYEKYQTITLRESDFLKTDLGKFDCIVMNPPFRRGTDVVHIRKALGHLNPGGRLVSLCYNGSAQNKALKPLATTWEVLPPGSFKESGTMSDVVMLSIFT